MILKKYLEEAIIQLKKSNIESAGLDAKILTSDYYGYEFHELILNEDKIMSANDRSILGSKLSRRLSGEPIAYIVGYKYFYKSKFIVNKDVLIPRPETELLAEQAIIWGKGKADLKILDMGSGSGCLGQSVLKELPSGKLVSIDISDKAIEVAQVNAQSLGLDKDIEFKLGNINNMSEEKFSKNFDIILANPPYIDNKNGFVETNVKKFEPSVALFSEDSGMKDILSWSSKAAAWLRPGGLYLMEFGEEQVGKIEELFKQNNFFIDLSVHKDYSGLPRFVRAIK